MPADKTDATRVEPIPHQTDRSEPVEPQILQDLAHNHSLSYGDFNRIGMLIKERTALGVEKYGQALHTFDGRDAATDALQELLDLLQYLTKFTLEMRARQADFEGVDLVELRGEIASLGELSNEAAVLLARFLGIRDQAAKFRGPEITDPR